MKIVGVEEHFVTPEVLDAWRALDPEWQDLSLAPSTQGDSARAWPTSAKNAWRRWMLRGSTSKSSR